MGEKKVKILERFVKYSSVGVIAVTIDYAMLWVLKEWLSVYYLAAVAVAFIIAHTVNFIINKRWSFKGTGAEPLRAYILFLGFGVCTLFIITFVTWFFTEYVGLYYLISRVLGSMIAGLFNFLFNYFITFNMAGEAREAV